MASRDTAESNQLFNSTFAENGNIEIDGEVESDMIGEHKLANIDTNFLSKPKVEATVWYFSILECSFCESLHHTVTQYLIGDDVIKAWKGALHVYCMFFHDARSCMRFVETYTELIAMDIFDGVLGRNFTCTEVFKVCNTPY